MENSLERIFPDKLANNEATGSDSLNMHLERYRYAGNHLITGTVADIACGTGYGSMLLATEFKDKARSVISIDKDEISIRYAKSRYAHPCITYRVADVFTLESSVQWDNIVSLETIEHLADPELFIESISRHINKGGRFIASVPITPSMDANPFHLHDFTIKSIRKLFTGHSFKEIDFKIQVQHFNLIRIALKKEKRSRSLRRNILNFYLLNPGKLIRRLLSLIKDGFVNKYYVGVFEKI